MSYEIQRRRGTTAQHSSFTGLAAEITVDTDKNVVVVHDGSTAGGYPLGGTATAQTWTEPQRGDVTTDNDLSFDLSASNNFSSTPTGNGTLTFTNPTVGQSGFILLDNSGGHTISGAANVKVSGGFLSGISATGVYLLSYFTDGTDVYVVTSGALS
jgi:hypothetical protein